ncbi:ABC transporter permease [Elstera cyanobacteriorum]|uniref:ABC transporter permease n=1 Tax=Elstera cyanobacteriorum TaxID=2022747 RepID=A0A255XYG3_9PROT|nr:sugar ABC transporter permease [Elstera cyanobacteriorum]OYQ21962.1 ABC transporter permease [Elstera cyanobacteriorum]GGA02908.1 ABC transporter permease [Elstera cyanobacteriorum]
MDAIMTSPVSLSRPAVQRSFWRRHEKTLAPAMFLSPALFAFLLFVVWPILSSVWISFHEWDGLGPKIFIGLDNYRELFSDDKFYVALVNNIKWLILYLLAPVGGLIIALFLNQQMPGMRLIKALFFFPFVISQVVVGVIFSWFYDPNFGLLNVVLNAVGLPSIAPLGDEHMVTYAIIVAGLWPQIAYCMILYLTGLNNVNPELIEAARMDGCKGFPMFWNIILPQLRPATFIAVVVTVIGALRSFDLVAIMTNGGPYDSSTVLGYFMYEQAIFAYRMGYGAAIATVLFLIMDIYIAFFLVSMLRKEAE